MEIPITQSKAWEHLQHDLGEETFFKKTDDYQFLAILKHTRAGNYLFVPYGPLSRDQKSSQKALAALTSLAQSKSVIFIRIEPRSAEMAQILPPTAKKVHDINPADTWILDLTADRPTIVKNFTQGTRTCFNNYAKKGIIIEKTHDPDEIQHLVALQAQVFQNKHLHVYSAKYLKTQLSQPFATLYLAKYHEATDEYRKAASDAHSSGEQSVYPAEGQILAAALFFDFNGTRYYMQSASDNAFRRLPATVAILGEAIFDAKAAGLKHLDFWGIAPDDAPKSHPWYGFTKFKKSFGGAPLHYAGTYDIILNPFRYRLFAIAKHLLRAFHH